MLQFIILGDDHQKFVPSSGLAATFRLDLPPSYALRSLKRRRNASRNSARTPRAKTPAQPAAKSAGDERTADECRSIRQGWFRPCVTKPDIERAKFA